MASKLKQAVLLIHGIGEQQPMDTLRGFVDVVWTTDATVKHAFATPGIFSKPDDLSGSYELRRLTTTQDCNGVITDFYEYYWAHLMEGTTLMGHVWPWMRYLMLRWPTSLPARLRGAWWVLLGLLGTALGLFLLAILPEPALLPRWLSGLLGVVVSGTIVPVLNTIVGDAARYLSPRPANIKCRQEIRAKGVELFHKLHQSGQYQRMIVVGHSLGSIIGYDILTYAWPAYVKPTNRSSSHPSLDALETTLAREVAEQPSVMEFQHQQRGVLKELRRNNCTWLVTDFVTLGSPLAHADLLLAPNREALRVKQSQREWPTCPPVLEKGRFSYPADYAHRKLHQAALFGPTRWTNLYFPKRWLLKGDIVGGPLKPLFGWGIRDCPVTTAHWWGLLSHTAYWSVTSPADSHIACLREALNLADK